MNLKSILITSLLFSAALAVLAPPANAQPQAWACTDVPYDDACPSTLCVSLTTPTSFCTTRSICVVGETRCIGNLACVDLSVGPVCVADPCYTTACFASSPESPPVGGCNDVTSECDGNLVCVWISQQTPQCVRDPCPDFNCVSPPPCACAPFNMNLQANPSCILFVEKNTELAGVTYHDCYYVDGYVCTEPVWYGGHGIWGWVCEASTPFSLP